MDDDISYTPGGTFSIKYFPLRSVAAPNEVPFIIILQPINGSLFSSKTVPEIFPVVPAYRLCNTNRKKKRLRKLFNGS